MLWSWMASRGFLISIICPTQSCSGWLARSFHVATASSAMGLSAGWQLTSKQQ